MTNKKAVIILSNRMHAYLLTGTDEGSLEKKAKELADKNKASLMEFELQKIADVRELSRFTSLKIDDKTAVLIKGIDKATREALNAFLKNLEEPQEDLFYILTADSKHSVIPTIVSRCQVVRAGEKKAENKTVEFARKFLGMSKVEKLSHIKEYRKRDDALEFLDKIVLGTHELLKDSSLKKGDLAELLEEAEQAKKRINAYGNPSLQLTNFVLQVV